jgi:hypothetical protein
MNVTPLQAPLSSLETLWGAASAIPAKAATVATKYIIVIDYRVVGLNERLDSTEKITLQWLEEKVQLCACSE